MLRATLNNRSTCLDRFNREFAADAGRVTRDDFCIRACHARAIMTHRISRNPNLARSIEISFLFHMNLFPVKARERGTASPRETNRKREREIRNPSAKKGDGKDFPLPLPRGHFVPRFFLRELFPRVAIWKAEIRKHSLSHVCTSVCIRSLQQEVLLDRLLYYTSAAVCVFRCFRPRREQCRVSWRL